VTQKFEASKDNKVELPDPYKLTFLKEGYKSLILRFLTSTANLFR
jgi:hypothetical protein